MSNAVRWQLRPNGVLPCGSTPEETRRTWYTDGYFGRNEGKKAMHLKNKTNEYMKILGSDYDKIPKTVLAALAVSFALRIEEDDWNAVKKRIIDEWRTLHENGIVPQKPISL